MRNVSYEVVFIINLHQGFGLIGTYFVGKLVLDY